MPEPIRVRDDKTGAEYSTYAVNENGETYEGLTVLDEDAVDATGALLPAKYPAAEKTAEVATPKPPRAAANRPATTEEN